MRNKLNSIKNHLHHHRFKYGVATGVVSTIAVCHVVANRVDELKEFSDEYITPHMATSE